MSKIRLIEKSRTVVKVKGPEPICTTIIKEVQVKFLKKWITIHKYELEIWSEN